MRVAIDARGLSERNTSNRTYWAELVAALGRRSDVELSLISNSPLAPEDIPDNARAVVAETPNRWFSLVTLPKLALAEGAEVVHVQYTVSPLHRLPVVTMVHDVSYFIEPSWFGAKDRVILQRTVPAACRRAARVVVPSETCRKELLRFIPVTQEKVMVTLEGTPTALLREEKDSAADMAVRHFVKGAPFVLLVGGAAPRKNLKGAIEAVRLAREAMPDLRLLVTGRLAEKPSEPWVASPGPLPEPLLAAAYRTAYALLHPSLHEGFGLTLLEAMGFGLPVVASNRGSIPEIAGEAASLSDPLDAHGLADGLIRLGDPSLRENMVAKGRARAAQFTWDQTAEQTIAAYRAAV